MSVIAVDDAGAALRRAAEAWRARFDPLVVGITGSIAKTSTKEQVAEVLAARWTVLRNDGNENNEVGLPLTLLRLGPEHDAAVLEMGMYVAGDIAVLAALARPSIGVVTAVRATHLERAGSLDAIERGKRELVEALPRHGTAVLNADDPRVNRMREYTEAHVLRYGFAHAVDVAAEEVAVARRARHALHAAAPRPDPGRGRDPGARQALGPQRAGRRGSRVCGGTRHRRDRPRPGEPDSARPTGRTWCAPARGGSSTTATTLTRLDGRCARIARHAPGRHVAVLGEMLELGDRTDESHREVGRRAAQLADRITAPAGVAALVYGLVRRSGPPARALASFAGLGLIVALTAFTFSPWPREPNQADQVDSGSQRAPCPGVQGDQVDARNDSSEAPMGTTNSNSIKLAKPGDTLSPTAEFFKTLIAEMQRPAVRLKPGDGRLMWRLRS